MFCVCTTAVALLGERAEDAQEQNGQGGSGKQASEKLKPDLESA